MNILFCQPTLDHTGSETSLLGIVRMLRRRGGGRLDPLAGRDGLHLLAGRDGPMADSFDAELDSLTIIDAPKVRRRIAVIPRFFRSFWTAFAAVRRLKKTHAVTLVYVNTVMFPQAPIAARLNGLDCVVHIHEVESKYPWVVYQWYVALATLLARRLICVCEYIPRQRRIFFKSKMRRKARVIHNASAFDPGPIDRRPSGMLRILTVGTLSRLKGTGDIPRFAEALARRIGPERFELVLVGRVHDDKLYKEVTAALRDAKLDGRISFAGVRPDIERFYREADVLLHPARSDVFPMVLVEAASFSLPVVTTDAGGCPEAVADGETGFVVPAADPEAMAERVARLADDPALYGAMSAAAYRRYTERFTPERMIDGVTRVLDDFT